MQLFNVLAVLFVCVIRLHADQSVTTEDPRTGKVCFSYHAYFEYDANNRFQAEVTSVALHRSKNSTTSDALARQDSCSTPRTNYLYACVEAADGIERLDGFVFIKATCTQTHNRPANSIRKATTFTMVEVMGFYGDKHHQGYTPNGYSGTYKVTCTTEDGGNTLNGVKMQFLEGNA